MVTKEHIKQWLKDKYNLLFLAVIVVAIGIRLYYWVLTQAQPLWWDEADYLAYAKNIAGFPVDWVVTAKHNSLYPFIVAVFFKLGATEFFTKLFVQVIPSIASVILVYLLANEMYHDKRVGLIASSIMAVFWVSLFNTSRFHIDILALCTALLTFYVFWTGYEQKKKIFGKIGQQWAIPLAVLLVILTYSIRRGYFLIGLFILAYMLLTTRFSALIKDKYNWIGLGIGLILFFGVENAIFNSGITSVSGGYYHNEYPINFLPFNIFKDFFSMVGSKTGLIFFSLFWVGFVLAFIKLALSAGHIRNSGSKTKADLFNIIAIFATLALFIFVLRTPNTHGEARWYLPLALASFIFIARPLTWILDKLKEYNRPLSIILVVVLVMAGAYGQIAYANATITNSVDSFDGIRKAGLHLKEISQPYDIILTVPAPQVAYYSERAVIRPANWINWTGLNEDIPQDQIFEKIRENPFVRYLVISFSEPNHPLWMKTITSAQKTSGETIIVTWEIPFMDTKINFINGEQEIKQTKSFDGLTFNLVAIRDEVFIYEIVR